MASEFKNWRTVVVYFHPNREDVKVVFRYSDATYHVMEGEVTKGRYREAAQARAHAERLAASDAEQLTLEVN